MVNYDITVGQVRDTTNAVVANGTVTSANPETGLRRSAKTDEAGRFNFPQTKPDVVLHYTSLSA
jgi:hypothetical protein